MSTPRGWCKRVSTLLVAVLLHKRGYFRIITIIDLTLLRFETEAGSEVQRRL